MVRSLLFFVATLFTCTFHAQSLPSWCIGPFKRPPGVNPVIDVDTTTFFDPMSKTRVKWKESDVFNPAATIYKDSIAVLYRSEDNSATGIGKRTSRVGLAMSGDGIKMRFTQDPVLYPDLDDQKEFEWPGGCEDPRVAVTEDGLYVMLYTQWNRKTPRLGVATSRDLVHWEKHGPAFQNAKNSGLIFNKSHKSASIVTKLKNDRLVITKVKGKYWMYWGEDAVYGATSDNLLDWEPVVDAKGVLHKFIVPRKGYFDSKLTECGPPALLTKKGIVLLYNGKNDKGENADKNYTENSYCAGQVLFSKKNPTKAIARLDKPFLIPEADFEKSGQYPDGTVFIEGLVRHQGKWFLYYGCADSKVAVVISEK